MRADATGGSAVTVQLPDRPFSISRGGSTIEDAAALERAGDKERTAHALTAHGIPVPEHVVTTLGTLDEVEPFLARWGTVVVKPARDTSAGRGVTTSVRDAATLRTAAVAAAAAGSRAGRTSRSGPPLRTPAGQVPRPRRRAAARRTAGPRCQLPAALPRRGADRRGAPRHAHGRRRRRRQHRPRARAASGRRAPGLAGRTRWARPHHRRGHADHARRAGSEPGLGARRGHRSSY